MYGTLLWLHSNWRWAVALTGVLAIARGWYGLIAKQPWTKLARMLGVLFVSAVDVQFVFGVTLYLFFSPITHAAFSDMRGAMHNPQLRFFTVEHGPSMLLAVAFVHIGNVHARRAPNDVQRHRRFAIWLTVAAALMFFAMPWPWLDVARPLVR